MALCMSIFPGGQDRIVWLDWVVGINTMIPWKKGQRSKLVPTLQRVKEESVCFKDNNRQILLLRCQEKLQKNNTQIIQGFIWYCDFPMFFIDSDEAVSTENKNTISQFQ